MSIVCEEKVSRPVRCIGAANVDRLGKIAGPTVLATSNPGAVIQSAGGVARNVAVALAALECPVALTSRVGNDVDGDYVFANIDAVDTAGISRSESCPTATYTALLSYQGELVIALADMAIYDEMTIDTLASLAHQSVDDAIWFVDTNLPIETLQWIATIKGDRQLFADTVSVAKAPKLRPILGILDGIFCNRMEAVAILGGGEEHSIAELALALAEESCIAGVVTDGAAPLAFWSSAGHQSITPETHESADVTGAGDALIAGVLAGLANGQEFDPAVRFGVDQANAVVGKIGA